MKNIPCEHKKIKGHCKLCRPKNYCYHQVHRSHCRTCNPRGWAVGILCVARGMARRRKYAKPNITPEDLVAVMIASKFCCGCGSKLEWDKKPSPHLHHCHKTGHVSGFAHPTCNQAEGMLSKLTSQELEQFIVNFFPQVFE